MSVKGTYKGTTFRSLMELSFMIMKEKEGLVLGDTLLYETLSVKYRTSTKGRERRYIVDFYAPELNIAWEVKPRSRRLNKKNLQKAAAATLELGGRGIIYEVIDEDTIPRLTTIEAAKIQGVKITSGKRRRR